MDLSINSVLGRRIELTEEFKVHYETWLQKEVFENSIDWDQLIESKLL